MKLWNDLDNNTKQMPSLRSFKNKLKKDMFRQTEFLVMDYFNNRRFFLVNFYICNLNLVF